MKKNKFSQFIEINESIIKYIEDREAPIGSSKEMDIAAIAGMIGVLNNFKIFLKMN